MSASATVSRLDPSDRLLLAALAISVGVHAALLAVRFVDPELFTVRSLEPPLEIVLVNAKSDTKPGKAQALAQANLDGGGMHEKGLRSSPLPNTGTMRDGDTLDVSRRQVEQLEEEQKRLLAAMKGGMKKLAVPRDPTQDSATKGAATEEARETLARMQAVIDKQVSDYQARPRKHHFMPSTSEYRYARYVEDWRAQVEKIGNEHYPEEARGKVYGSLRVTVAIRKDGSLVDTVLEQSSGSALLDAAARRIVKLSAPFPPFPPEIAKDTDILEITRTWIFTNDQLATRSAAGPKP
ncbi:MAG: energy transducer TonB [Betaproteobacteria bacterium]